MTKRMLIDATHAEETRVVVLDGNRLEDFDVETAARRQLKGNIYLAKVIRVEPSLQAAFVDYGGGRHGFLAFGEIHPDYYQIPVADRQRLLAMQAEEARAAEAEEEAAVARGEDFLDAPREAAVDAEPTAPDEEAPVPPVVAEADRTEPGETPAGSEPDDQPWIEDHPWRPAQPATIARDERFGPAEDETAPELPGLAQGDDTPAPANTAPEPDAPTAAEAEPVTLGGEEPASQAFAGAGAAEPPAEDDVTTAADERGAEDEAPTSLLDAPAEEAPPPETVGGSADAAEESADEARARRASTRMLRSYRIQEVIHRRQIMLVQVVKEERGTKGAALTTYISLAGRFSVLMPNSPRGGGISRKITSAADRKRLREVTAELDLPEGMGLIVRTAGANRPKPEIKRDCEYLMRLWDDIREHTFRSVAPALIYEEASLIKRAIRDVYSRDIDEILVDGEEGWRSAHDFMRMLMPSHAKKVQLWRPGADGTPAQSLFAKYQVEAQLDAMVSPTVPLKSGGYLVINQTEALVAIDVNSGRSTRERNIEETALRTNLEAADEAARQLRLRDLAGLIVIDFIDMESRRHNAAVERRLKDALRVDRARIQVGSISHFGLLEMSRQRLRPSVTETTFEPCPRCGGTGHVRTIDGSAIQVLRAIEEEGARQRYSVVMVHAAASVVMYLLNHKRERLAAIEQRFGLRVQFAIDDDLLPGQSRIDKVRGREEAPPRPASSIPVVPAAPVDLAGDADEEDIDEGDSVPAEAAPGEARAAGEAEGGEDGDRRKRRRRRRRGGRRDGQGGEGGTYAEAAAGDEAADVASAGAESAAAGTADPVEADATPAPAEPALEAAADGAPPGAELAGSDEDGAAPARRRGRRGGRRRRRDGEEEGAEASALPPPAATRPAYVGPTPADPYGGGAFDIFDMIDTAAEVTRVPIQVAPPPAPEPAPPEAIPGTTGDGAAETSSSSPADDVGHAQPVPEPEPTSTGPTSTGPTPAEPISTEPAVVAPPAPTVAEEPAGPVVGPAIEPVLIGGDTAPGGERKRGWWRR